MGIRNLTALAMLAVMVAGPVEAALPGAESAAEAPGSRHVLTLQGRPLPRTVQLYPPAGELGQLAQRASEDERRSWQPVPPGKLERAMWIGMGVGGGVACFLGAGYGDGNLCGEYSLVGMGIGLLFGVLIGAAQSDDPPQP